MYKKNVKLHLLKSKNRERIVQRSNNIIQKNNM